MISIYLIGLLYTIGHPISHHPIKIVITIESNFKLSPFYPSPKPTPPMTIKKSRISIYKYPTYKVVPTYNPSRANSSLHECIINCWPFIHYSLLAARNILQITIHQARQRKSSIEFSPRPHAVYKVNIYTQQQRADSELDIYIHNAIGRYDFHLADRARLLCSEKKRTLSRLAAIQS